ncbi:hypothetical protein CAPTEDRAFT_118704 [Capitella teleta]|uniref:protein-tyrosine-phosphatase n=1 Tax=Capitella teleta TaxID=283909 RepID=R7TC89_CAPTE|nr:hypothetical protein CAPTEDRAFT_118704 [Capitella teleta]|eukprot:ELT88711.1 hypothetical protein CAPTEDRAFT_118704 [Capitella teleta]
MAIRSDQYHLAQISEILYHHSVNYPGSPTQILDHVFIGNYKDAENIAKLQSHGITHVLNCAAFRKCLRNPYPTDSGITDYEQFEADDCESYSILQHFPRAREFIDRAKHQGGKVLIHCAMGVNRSGAICVAYVMVDQKVTLIDAIRKVKGKRNAVLCNKGFQRQLIGFARQKGLL